MARTCGEENGTKCDNPAQAAHPCPFREDILGDEDTQCTCCDDCAHECAMDI